MKMFQCDRCGRIFYPDKDKPILSNIIPNDTTEKFTDLCPNCIKNLIDYYSKSNQKENIDYLDKFCNQLKRIKDLAPEFRIGQLIQILNYNISYDGDVFCIEDKIYVDAAELYADRLEEKKEKGEVI